MADENCRLRGTRATSVVSAIIALEVGESLSRVRRYPGPNINLQEVRAWSKSVHNTLSTSVTRARRSVNQEYVVELIDARTIGMAVISGIVVTRLA